MNNTKLFYINWLSVFLIFLFGVQGNVGAGVTRDLEKPMGVEWDNSLEMPMLKGDVWQTMSHDSKVSFIWGFGHVVTVEGALMNKYPELKRDSFVSKTIEGMKKMSMNQVVDKVDEYYKSNPKELDAPVINVIWKVIIKPNINMGIAGHPLAE